MTFRLTDAWVNKREFSTVSMRSPMRLRKVSQPIPWAIYPLTLPQFQKHESRYTDKEWTHNEWAAFEDAIQMHGAELRAVREEVGSRTMPEVVRFYGHWKKYAPSSTTRVLTDRH